MPGLLTTHVLDTMHGVPAVDLRIELWRLTWLGEQQELRELLVTMRTDSAGRTERPLLQGEALLPGTYELLFSVGEYFAGRQVALPDPSFLSVVPVRFGIADRDAHYHVPLLVSPWAYSTYRGS